MFDPAKHTAEWTPPRSGERAIELHAARNEAQHQARFDADMADMADLTQDEIIAEDIYFRYGIDLPEAIQVHNLMSFTAPPADLYVTHPELYNLWLKRFTNDDPYFQQQLDLFYGEHGFGEAIYGE